ncbi:Rne/Rng family ribonuclease [Neomicrococcus aestuarii]|uniref:Rne/Rng family ribonuclease n=1 Tax=Neomicrococcus aestuarii TaxID=556325 RepID=UPI000AF4DA4B|nr:Rne/Rng family ribonuclease [Neomicrococcus aestuarii]
MDQQSNHNATPENVEENVENSSISEVDAPAVEEPAVDASAVEAEEAVPENASADETSEDEVEEEADKDGDAEAEESSAPAQPVIPVNPFELPAGPGGLVFHAPDLSAIPPIPSRAPKVSDDKDDDEAPRGSRSRRRSRSRVSSQRTEEVTGEDADVQDSADADEEPAGSTLRRRRRRRRGDADIELEGGSQDDPPNTVTRVRVPRSTADSSTSQRVTAVKGSTRLEAKRQRRRESREVGRRRHVITEAEFLARRESVDRQMMVRQNEDRIQIAVLEDGILAEHFVSKTQQDSLIGSVYVGKVQNVLPSMEAAFVDIGRGRNAVLYAGEVNWDVAGLDGQPRRIEHAMKSGDTVLVQVTKDPVGHKGARLTSQISLPGRYLVYVPGGSMTGISRKLPDVERSRLKKILKDHLPENAGVIVRTAAEGASEEELMNDINRLRAQWEDIEAKAKSTKTLAPEILYGEPDLTIKVVRDVFNEDFSKLVVQGDEAWDTIEAYVTYVAPDLVGRLEKWDGDKDIFAKHRIDEQIHKALDRKVFLPSGGSLVIDRTEAMTVVDVNTGKFTGSGGNLEETVTKNNLEAAEEIVRQLRLRDIGGIIVIDFIDMVLESNRDLVLRRLVECLGRDRTKHQVAEVTSLGLVQMTRKRMGTGLLEVFSEQCDACAGRGIITHDEPVEHRHTPSQEHSNNSSNRPSRAERRRRSKDKDTVETVKDNAPASTPVAAPAAKPAAATESEDPEKSARAQAARKAFASIAAAAHAAHEPGHEDQAGETPAEATQRSEDSTPGHRPFEQSSLEQRLAEKSNREQGSRDQGSREGSGRNRSRKPRRSSSEAQRGGGDSNFELPQRGEDRTPRPVENVDAEDAGEVETVVVHGEKIALPRGRRERRVASSATQAPQLTLDALAAALDAVAPLQHDDAAREKQETSVASKPTEAPTEAAVHVAPAQATQAVLAATQAPQNPGNPEPVSERKQRRRRVASSQQGAGNTEIHRHDGEAQAQGSSFTASVAQATPAGGARGNQCDCATSSLGHRCARK